VGDPLLELALVVLQAKNLAAEPPELLAQSFDVVDESAAEGRRVSATAIVERLIGEYLARKGGKHGRA